MYCAGPVTSSFSLVWAATKFNVRSHTPSIAFRHPPPNSARNGYATDDDDDDDEDDNDDDDDVELHVLGCRLTY